MPSPIVHSATGYLIYRIFRRRLPQQGSKRIGIAPALLLMTIGLSILPDIDWVLALVTGDFGGFHNRWTHSLILGLAVSLAVSGAVWLKEGNGALRWFTVSFLCYGLHVIMDAFTIGRGVMILWPFSPDRYASPVSLFYGVHWSDGWVSVRHLWTMVTELALLAAAGLFIHLGAYRKVGRSPTTIDR